MPDPKIVFKKNALDEILDVHKRKFSNQNDIERYIENAINEADNLMDNFERRVRRIKNNKKEKQIVRQWKDDNLMKRYFGNKKISKNQAKFVHKKIKKIRDLIQDKKLTIVLRPNKKRNTIAAHNYGGAISKKRITIFTNGFTYQKSNIKSLALLIIHELFHWWFFDRKINGKTAYKNSQVKLLAHSNPKKARKNPANYEWFADSL